MMRKVKCILSILIGSLLGLVASCTQRHNPPKALEQPQDGQPPAEKKNPEPPKKEQELPVRRPMLE